MIKEQQLWKNSIVLFYQQIMTIVLIHVRCHAFSRYQNSCFICFVMYTCGVFSRINGMIFAMVLLMGLAVCWSVLR